MIFNNYTRLAFRKILHNKGINSINILGLAVGLMAVLLIFQYIRYEKGYDKFLENSDRLKRLVFYRFYSTGLDRSVGNNYYIGQIAAEKIPEIENFCRVKKETLFIRSGEQVYKEERTLFADSSFFDMFSYKVLSGDKPAFLRQPDRVILTESAARKYFGDKNPVGRVIEAVNQGDKPLTVQGVIADVPGNTHLKFDLLVSLSTITTPSYCYSCNNTNTYFLVRRGSDQAKIESQITNLGKENFSEREIKIDFPIEFHLQSVTDIHLHSDYRFEFEPNGNGKYLTILFVIAVLILFSAGLNYLNLYTSVTGEKISRIGVRIINGASGRNVILEFVTEALITGLISLILSFVLLYLLFPLAKTLLSLSFNSDVLFDIRSWLIPVSFLVVLSLVTGFFTGIKIYNVTPVTILNGDPVLNNRKKSKYIYLSGQFVIVIALIGCTLGALKQINFMQKEAFTMNIDQTLVVKRPASVEFNPAQKSFQEALLKYPGISEITYSTIAPGEKNGWVKGGISLKGKENQGFQFFQMDVSPDFFKFFNVKLLAGRNFFSDETNWTGGPKHIILNREAAGALGEEKMGDLIGKIMWDTETQEEMGEIVGIIDGYFQNSLDQEIKPTIFNCDQVGYNIFIRIKDADSREMVSKVKNEFLTFFKDQYFEYYFLDDFFNAQYKSHVQLFRSFILFSLMAVLISCLSLFGLVIAATASRTKEIGIRKINGAKVSEILFLLNKDYLILVSAAYLISVPVIWVSVHKWIEGFAYRAEMNVWIFLIAGVMALGITLLTVSWQTWRAATRNPVEALRYE